MIFIIYLAETLHSFSFHICLKIKVFYFQVFKKLTRFFKSLGVKAVFDTSCSRDLTLIESCNEFISRYKHNQLVDDESSKLGLPMIASACPGIYLNLCINICEISVILLL